MVFSIRKWTSRLLFIVIFLLMLIVATGGYRWLIDAIAPIDPYHKPKGEAVKAFTQHGSPEGGSIADRLRWFYWYGE